MTKGDYCVKDVGFFISDIWRFGKLYNFLAIAAQAMLMDKPCTIEEQGSGAILLKYDGDTISGDEEVVSLVMDSINTLTDELTGLVNQILTIDREYREAMESV